MFSYDDPNNSSKNTATYENAPRSHKAHNDRHGYLHHVLRCTLVSVMYSKPAHVLSVILQELVNHPEERLEWLVYVISQCREFLVLYTNSCPKWHDAGLVLMNSEISVGAFLPPSKFAHVHLVVTNDIGGLNSDVFLIRVNEWAVSYLIASISYKSWDPNFLP